MSLSVWYGEMPETNGRRNWTAMLYRPGDGPFFDEIADGYMFARSEYPDRVRYEADLMRWMIGEREERPDILAYDPDLHSGYVDPTPSTDTLVATAFALAAKVCAGELVDEAKYGDRYIRYPSYHRGDGNFGHENSHVALAKSFEKAILAMAPEDAAAHFAAEIAAAEERGRNSVLAEQKKAFEYNEMYASRGTE